MSSKNQIEFRLITPEGGAGDSIVTVEEGTTVAQFLAKSGLKIEKFTVRVDRQVVGEEALNKPIPAGATVSMTPRNVQGASHSRSR